MATDLVVYDQATRREVQTLLGIKGSDSQLTLLFKLAEHYQLDVLTKEIALIPGKGPFIGVWGRLHIAHRSGRLDGLEVDDQWETETHYCVRCIVWRNDMRHPAAKVIGRVARTEKKEWPFEIARARGLRAALGYAFSIHDSYDDGDGDDWNPAPDEHLAATINGKEDATATTTTGRVVDPATGEVVGSGPVGAGRGEADNRDDTAASSEPAAKVVGSTAPPTDTEPATIIVGGHSLAQRVAIAARHAGIDDDDTRHEVIQAASGGRWARGTDIPDDDPNLDTQHALDRVFEAFAGLADGTVELRYDPGGQPRLVRPKKQ